MSLLLLKICKFLAVLIDQNNSIKYRNFLEKRKNLFYSILIFSTQLNCIVAIDYTGSNGDQRDPGSLHYFNHQNPNNQYTNAITAVGTIIQVSLMCK